MFLQQIIQNKIVRNVAMLVSGTAIAQLILIGFQLILRRLYSPEIFGIFDLYMSIVSILTILSTLRYELSIVLPKDSEQADNLVVGGIIIALIINSIIFIFIVCFKNWIADLMDFPATYSFWLYFIPLSTLLLSIYQFITYWLIRNSAFRSVAVNKVFRRSFEGITQTLCGIFKQHTGLITGDIIGNLANIISGYFQARKHHFSFSGINLISIKNSLKKYIDFPKYQAFPALLNTTTTLLPIFFINEFFTKDCVGFFGLSRQILAVPIAFITASLSQVLLKDFSDRVKNSQLLTPIFTKTTLLLSCGILPFVIIIMLWGDHLFAFFFSETWKESGSYAAILVIAFAVQFIVSPLSIAFTVLEKLKTLAIWQICYFGLVISMIFFKHIDIHYFLMLYTGINVFAYGIYFFLIRTICKKYDKITIKLTES